MSPAATLPESIDLTHHINKRVRTAQPSAMKAMGRILQSKKGLLSLGGGMPHPSLFPMSHATFTAPTLSSLEAGKVDAWKAGTSETELLHLKKTGLGAENDEDGILDLNDILQYGLSNGFGAFLSQLEELNGLLHGKTIRDASIYLTLGNTDGVSKTFQLLVEPDIDTVLTEEYTFASSLNSGRSKGAKFYPIKTDNDGLLPSDLDHVLTNWDEATQGRKPHLLYTIPCGQNPTGSIQSPERYDEIYRIAQKHDIVIAEDDPYFPLQYTGYIADKAAREQAFAAARAKMPPLPTSGPDDAQGVAKVFNEYANVRSYLSRDTDGRVVRIDTFSKVFGPGIRLGWISANANFVERLLRIGESTTQTPNNLGQAVLASYLSPDHWGVSGFIRWMWAVRLEYQLKRDHFLDIFHAHVPSDLVSTIPCGGGMFQWLQVNIEKHPRFARTVLNGPIGITSDTLPDGPQANGNGHGNSNGNGEVNGNGVTEVAGLNTKEGDYTTNTGELIDELWTYLVEEYSVLLLPAKLFQVQKEGVDQTHRLNYFRATFAGDLEGIEAALKAFGKGVEEWFKRG